MTSLPSPFVEATNGILLVVVFWMIVFNVFYLIRARHYMGMWRFVYRECKAAIALLGFLLGIEIRTFVLWAFRHMQNHNIDATPYREAGIILLTLGCVLAIWGGICWIKVTMPIRCKPSMWWLLTASALIFGIGMAW